MNWSKHTMLTIVAALLVIAAVAAAWAAESGFGRQADAGSLPLVALGSATTASGPGTSTSSPGSSSMAQMRGAANGRLVMSQSLRMNSSPMNSGAPGAGGTMMTSPATTDAQGKPGTTTPTSAGPGGMSTGSPGMGMGTQSTTGTTAHAGSDGMMGTTLTTSARSPMPTTTATSAPSTTGTTTHMGGGIGGTMGGSGMGGSTTR
jgi:hypothetical protein